MATEKNVPLGTRLASMVLDHVFMTIICMLFFVPSMIKAFAGAFSISHEQKEVGGFSGPLLYIGLFGLALYFCKDCINGRSIAKRILKLQVVDNGTGEVASPLQCFIRNISCIIWPVEVIMALVNPNRRIGDHVAGTKLVAYDPLLVEQPRVVIVKVLVPLVLSFGLLVLVTVPFRLLRLSIPGAKYVESSYNEAESKALEQLYSDSLGRNLSASVRVYDKVERHPSIKYISVIYRLKENYLDDPDTSEELKRATMRYLHTMFPQSTFTGRAQYVYQQGGNMQASSNQIGMPIWK